MGYIGTGERAVAAQESLDGRRELAPSLLKAWGKDAEWDAVVRRHGGRTGNS